MGKELIPYTGPPIEHEDIMVTYRKCIDGKLVTVTKWGFYHKLFYPKVYIIPPGWAPFNIGGESIMLPHGWGGDRLTEEQVIKWEYKNDDNG